MNRVRFLMRLLAAMGFLGGILFLPLTAWAHEEVDSGNYHFEIGWVNEPVILGQRNGLDLFVASADNPEEGIPDVSTLVFTVEYGGVNKSYDIVPVEGEDGHYTASFVPTREGQYTFHLTGSIEGESIDVSVEPEEVVSADTVSFPESQPSAAELTSRIAAAEARASTTQTIAIVGLVLGVIGVGLVAYATFRRTG
jgi:hypothetical protein